MLYTNLQKSQSHPQSYATPWQLVEKHFTESIIKLQEQKQTKSEAAWTPNQTEHIRTVYI